MKTSRKKPSRRAFMMTTGAGLSTLSLIANLSAGEGNSRPNVLFLFSDQHNADFMGCAGHSLVKTPNLDALAEKGTRFSRAYCQDGICVPSRTSIFSGLYPRTTGCLDNPNRPPDAERYTMLQHLFQQNGYRTGCFGKRHLPRAGKMALGWDRSATTISPKQDPSDENYWDWIKGRSKWATFERDWKGSKAADLMSHVSQLAPEERDAAYTAAKAIEFIRKAKAKKTPFFCWASFHGPHQPYTPPAKWAELYPPIKLPLPKNVRQPIKDLPPMPQLWRKNTKTPWNLATAAKQPEIYQRYASCYMGQVTEVDHYLGEIVKTLDDLGLREDTLIVYASDHGDFVGRHGMVEKCAVGHNVYEDTLRVPFIVSWAKQFKEGRECSDLVELLDIYPTLMDAAGLKKPAKLQELHGQSLVPALAKGAAIERPFAISENWSQVSLITKDHKLGVWIDTPKIPPYDKRHWRGKTPDLLFERASDPMELTNLVGKREHADVEKSLRTSLAEWIAATPDTGKRAIGKG